LKTFFEHREPPHPLDIIALNDDEWIVELKDVQDGDMIEVLDEEDNVIDELEVIEVIENLKDMSRAVSRYNKATMAKYRAVGGGSRKDKGMKAFKAQLKGRAKSAANVLSFGTAYKDKIEKGKSNFSRSFSGSIDNTKRAERGWSPKDARIRKS
tara:strand:- start:222 stop:683 length:462 start_codon:yes stop_codon:yes gene_type:complete